MAHLNTDNIDQALALKAPVKYADTNNFLFINSNKVLYLFGDRLLTSYELVIETCRTFCSYLNRITGVKQDSNLKDGHRQMRSTEKLSSNELQIKLRMPVFAIHPRNTLSMNKNVICLRCNLLTSPTDDHLNG